MSLDRSLERLKKYSFEISYSWIRPTSEIVSNSLLIRTTRNCPWGRCKFCDCWGFKFEYRCVEEIKKDIDSSKAIRDEISFISKLIGFKWAAKIMNSDYLYNKDRGDLMRDELTNLYSISLVYNWLRSDAHSVFLQDGNSLIMRASDLVEVIQYLRQTFPSVRRITSYARSKTLAKTRTLDELVEIHEAGLSRLHVGLESGDDDVLKYIDKGVNCEEHIQGGKKAKEAGFELSEYVMPGIGGRDMSEQHAKNTARVLNEINPDFIRMRPFVPRRGTTLFEEYEKGKFQLTSPHERLRELKMFIDELNVNSRICFDQPATCSWYKDLNRHRLLFKWDPNGYKFPEEKSRVLMLIKEGLSIDESAHKHAKNLIERQHL